MIGNKRAGLSNSIAIVSGIRAVSDCGRTGNMPLIAIRRIRTNHEAGGIQLSRGVRSIEPVALSNLLMFQFCLYRRGVSRSDNDTVSISPDLYNVLELLLMPLLTLPAISMPIFGSLIAGGFIRSIDSYVRLIHTFVSFDRLFDSYVRLKRESLFPKGQTPQRGRDSD